MDEKLTAALLYCLINENKIIRFKSVRWREESLVEVHEVERIPRRFPFVSPFLQMLMGLSHHADEENIDILSPEKQERKKKIADNSRRKREKMKNLKYRRHNAAETKDSLQETKKAVPDDKSRSNSYCHFSFVLMSSNGKMLKRRVKISSTEINLSNGMDKAIAAVKSKLSLKRKQSVLFFESEAAVLAFKNKTKDASSNNSQNSSFLEEIFASGVTNEVFVLPVKRGCF